MIGFAGQPVLHGGGVTLRPIVAGDADAMWADFGDEEGNRLTGTRPGLTREQVAHWCATRGADDDRLDLAVTDATTGEWLGEVVLNDWDADNRSCSFRIALSSHARDRGLGTTTTRLVLDHAFLTVDDPPLHRIDLEVHSFNPRAQAVYEKVGFVAEGRRRDTLLWDGAWVDTIHMGLLRADWAAARHGDRVERIDQARPTAASRGVPTPSSRSAIGRPSTST